MKEKICYVTGQEGASSYYFGSPGHVRLNLTQDVFAHFILRAGKDPMHQQIMADIKCYTDEVDGKSKIIDKMDPNTDDYIDAAIDFSLTADRFLNLLTQKAESGVRILRRMKRDFEKTGELSS